MENIHKNAEQPGDENWRENLRVKKTAYLKQELERQRAAEDARLERLLQEQEIIEGLRESVNDNMWHTDEVRKYNQEFQKGLNTQIYESNGITGDKLMGMREYKNALYQGCAAILFLLSLAMIVLCGVLHGFQSNICLLMFAYTAMEGALLSQKEKRPPILDFVCGILYILTYPTMLVMFVCYELEFDAYGFFLPYAVVLGTLITVVSIIPFFLQDPYRQDKKKLRDANNQIHDIERLAAKEVRKNQKKREKEERSGQKLGGFLARFKKPDKPQDGILSVEAEALPLESKLIEDAADKISEKTD